MQRNRLPRPRLAVQEMDEYRRRPAAAAHAVADVKPIVPHGPGQGAALLVRWLHDDGVGPQLRRNVCRRAGDEEQSNRCDLHGTIRRAPTHRDTHHCPSESADDRRDNFTPVPELWMNVCSPTYIPTCVTPPPGCAANNRMSPGWSASITGVTSLPERA